MRFAGTLIASAATLFAATLTGGDVAAQYAGPYGGYYYEEPGGYGEYYGPRVYRRSPRYWDGPVYYDRQRPRYQRRYQRQNPGRYQRDGEYASRRPAERPRSVEPDQPPGAKWEPKLTTQQRVAIQTALNRMGFDLGEVDGEFGRRTRAAIRAHQESLGVQATGYLVPTQVSDLLSALEAGLDQKVAVLTQDQRMAVQRALNEKGFDVGTPDAKFGTGTRAGIRQYQHSLNAPATGYLSQAQVASILNLETTGSVSRSAPQATPLKPDEIPVERPDAPVEKTPEPTTPDTPVVIDENADSVDI